MLLVDLNYNFECDWFVELSDNKLSDNKLSDNKLSDNNLASELVGNRSFFKPITIEEIVIFMITNGNLPVPKDARPAKWYFLYYGRILLKWNEKFLSTPDIANFQSIGNTPQKQEPITRTLHLPYKPSESTLSDEKLFIETVFGQNLSRPNA